MADRDAVINGLTIDTDTGNITIGQGATGWFIAVFENAAEGSIDIDTDCVLFIVTSGSSTKTIRSYVNGVYAERTVTDSAATILKKKFSVSVNDDGLYECVIGLTNEDTRTMATGSYVWNAILITDPAYDDDGMPIADDSTDEVIPFYTNGSRPSFTVEEVGYIV